MNRPDRYYLGPVSNLAGHWRLRGKVDAAIDTVGRHAGFGCEHAPHENRITLCVQHPAAGVICAACMRLHVATHTRAEEHGCDECDAVVDRIYGITIPLLLASGQVCVINAIGLCDTCAAPVVDNSVAHNRRHR